MKLISWERRDSELHYFVHFTAYQVGEAKRYHLQRTHAQASVGRKNDFLSHESRVRAEVSRALRLLCNSPRRLVPRV